jgi:WD40 repeat protein
MSERCKSLLPVAAAVLAVAGLVGADGFAGKTTLTARSPNGKLLAVAEGTTIRFFDAATQKEIRRLTGQGRITALAFAPDGKILAAGNEDKTVRLYEVETGKELRALRASAPVTGVRFSRDGKTVTAQGADQKAVTWEVATGKETK